MAPLLLQIIRNIFPTKGSYSVNEPEKPKDDLEVPESVTVFLSFDPAKIAEQITLMDAELFKAITREESTFAFERKMDQTPNISKLLERFVFLQTWVRDLMITTASMELRRQVLAHIVLLARSLHKLNNIHSAFAVMNGLHFWPLIRLTKTWKKLPKKTRKWFKKLTKVYWRGPFSVAKKNWDAWHSYGPRCVPSIHMLYKGINPHEGLEFDLEFIEYLQTGKFHLIAPKNPLLQDYIASIQFSKMYQLNLLEKAKKWSFDLEPKRRGPIQKVPWRVRSVPDAELESEYFTETSESAYYSEDLSDME